MHKVATKYDDPQMTDFLEGEFLKEQVKIIFLAFLCWRHDTQDNDRQLNDTLSNIKQGDA